MEAVENEKIQKEVEKKRMQACDYSEDIFKEYNMETLDSIYERSIKELNEFRFFFKLPTPDS